MKFPITDAVQIRDAFNKIDSGHFIVNVNGKTDDYDSIIPDSWVKSKYGDDFECEDSNGSDTYKAFISDGKVKFLVEVSDRCYGNGNKTVEWESKYLICTIKQINFENEFEIETIEEAKIKADIIDRWYGRIFNKLPLGSDGAELYLKKYGKGISNDKIKDLAYVSLLFGYPEMSTGFMNHMVPFSVFTVQQAESKNFNSDICEFDENCFDDVHEWKIIETTASYLASIDASPLCGNINDWKKTASTYPDLKVRTVLIDMTENGNRGFWTSSCDIYVDSKSECDKISDICGMRGEFECKGWNYFETE